MDIFLAFADFLFHILHLAMILVNTTFWLWARTLKLAQIALGLTTLSWFVFGIFYGWGYCFLTDWHWQIKEARGEGNLPLSYIQYILNWTPIDFLSSETINLGTAIVYMISVAGCIWKTFQVKATLNER